MNHRTLLVPICLGLMVTAQAAEPKGPAKPKEADLVLATPDYLSALARQLLKKRMERHGRDLSRLVVGVTLLQREVVKELAGDIASEPRIVRPLAEGRDELNSALPERFFVLQDGLRMRAKELADAALKKDDVALAQSFGKLVEICVGCHSAYLTDPKP